MSSVPSPKTGFVTFSDPSEAARALVQPYKIIDGRDAECSLAALGKDARMQRERELEREREAQVRTAVGFARAFPFFSL